jgi:hypothetical protein
VATGERGASGRLRPLLTLAVVLHAAQMSAASSFGSVDSPVAHTVDVTARREAPSP